MIDRGELPAVRVGSRRVRIQRDDLERFLTESRRLTRRSDTRVAFDLAVSAAGSAVRGKDAVRAATSLRVLSAAAAALAAEIDAGDS